MDLLRSLAIFVLATSSCSGDIGDAPPYGPSDAAGTSTASGGGPSEASAGGAAVGGRAAGGGGGSGGKESGPADGTADTSDAQQSSGPVACKRGIAYGFNDASAAADVAALAPGVSWFYGWAPQPSQQVAGSYKAAGVEFVPMVWGGNPAVAQLVAQIPSGAKYLLGFNEPNFGSQANMTPAAAAAKWPILEQVAQQRNLTLVSPAVNYCGGNCNETDPVAWLDKFFAACQGCRVDHVAVHWYACAESALKSYVERFTKYGKPIWVTEFSCGDQGAQPVAVQQAYMKDALAYLEAEPLVFRYAWFSGRTTAIANVDLLAGSGQLTQLGQDYVSLPPGGSCQRN